MSNWADNLEKTSLLTKCANCLHYTDRGICQVSEEVINDHGLPNLDEWLKKPNEKNGCTHWTNYVL